MLEIPADHTRNRIVTRIIVVVVKGQVPYVDGRVCHRIAYRIFVDSQRPIAQCRVGGKTESAQRTGETIEGAAAPLQGSYRVHGKREDLHLRSRLLTPPFAP